MTTPIRVQLRRAKGFRLATAAGNGLPTASVARPGKWGNPFKNQPAVDAAMFREWLVGGGYAGFLAARRAAILADLPSLRGKNLACFCRLPAEGQPDLCHAAVLMELAAKMESPP